MARSYKRDKNGRFASGIGGGSAQPRKALSGSTTVRNGSGGTTSIQPNKPYRKLGENMTNLGTKQTRKQATATARLNAQRRSDALKGSAATSGASSRGKSLRGKADGIVRKDRVGNRVKGMTAKNISADVAPMKGHMGQAMGNVSAAERNGFGKPGKTSRFSGASSKRTGNTVKKTGSYYAPSKFKASNRKKK